MAVAGIIVALDQATKLYILTHFSLGESVDVIRGFFNITYVQNPGAAFGIFRESNHIFNESFRQGFFLVMPPIAMLIIVLIMRGVAETDLVQVLGLSSIFGGAIGNYIDRVRFGYVVDFLDFHIQQRWSWPAFNVADSAIVCGVAVLIYIIFRKE
jgi:signal peptidase II